MDVPTDVFDCGRPCLSTPLGWGEVVLIFILLGLFVYTGVRNLSLIARLEQLLLDLLRRWMARLGWWDFHELQMPQNLDAPFK